MDFTEMYPHATEWAMKALEMRRSAGEFEWYLVPFLAFVFYVYFTEVERKNWNAILAGLAFWGGNWFLEILNGLLMHFSGYAAAWMAPADSAFLITIGLNIEICMMFAVSGVIFVKVLPEDKKMKIMGIPNRWFFIIANSIFCVIVEIILNFWDALIWEYWWWNWYNPILIIIIGYCLYFIFSYWIYDMKSMKKKIAIVSGLYAINIIGIIVFMGILGWI